MMTFQPKPAMSERRNSVFVGDVASDPSQLKSEMMIQQRKFDRLEYKEKRLQVQNSTQRLRVILFDAMCRQPG